MPKQRLGLLTLGIVGLGALVVHFVIPDTRLPVSGGVELTAAPSRSEKPGADPYGFSEAFEKNS